MKIFVSAASYRDPWLLSTIRNMMEGESHQHEIIYGIFEQAYEEESLLAKARDIVECPNVRYYRIDPELAMGAAWARANNVQQMAGDEDFYFQIDSHLRMEANWDAYYINEYRDASALRATDKIVFGPGCLIANEVNGQFRKKHLGYEAYSIAGVANGSPWPRDNILVPHNKLMRYDGKFHWCHVLRAGALFSDASFAKIVSDMCDYFFQPEEMRLTLGAFAEGYTMLSPRRLIVYHLDNNLKSKNWTDQVISNERLEYLYRRNHNAWQIFLEEMSTQVLKDYDDFSGIDYINKTVAPSRIFEVK